MKEKNTLVTQSCVLLDGWFRDLKFEIWGLEIKFVENYLFLENNVTSLCFILPNTLKAVDTIGNYSDNYQHKTSLGNK